MGARAAAATSSEQTRAHFGTAEAARITGLPETRVRQCIRAGLLRPRRDPRGRLRFDFLDLVLLRTTRGLLESRVPVRKIGRVLRSLRRQIGDRPLSRLSVFADGERVVAWDGSMRWQPDSGQFLFNFDAGRVVRQAARVAHLPLPQRESLPRLTAEQWCDLAVEIEESAPLEARAAYHHALDLEPDHVGARINLGRLLYLDRNLVGAEAHFREAVRQDPSCGLAWYNLAVVLDDTGRLDDALGCYEHAVRTAPDLADAHYNLSLLYERMGRRHDALHHLAIHRRLTAGNAE
ncbi:MAG: tetratricopeptide repeat protein [Candidatus Binatia bacterium]